MSSKNRVPRRFRVYVISPTGKATKGRYYNKGPNAWARAKFLREKLTNRFQVVVYHIHNNCIVSNGKGYWPCYGMNMFKPPQLWIAKA